MVFVPTANDSISNTPIGPFQMIVFDDAIAALFCSLLSGPQSSPINPAGTPSASFTPCLITPSSPNFEGEVDREDHFHVRCLSCRHDLRNNLRALLVKKRRTNVCAVQNLRKRESHAAADDHLVDLGCQILDELNLVRHLRATKNSEHRAGRVVENLGEGRELLLNQRTRDLYVEAIANHRRMGAVRGAESIVHVNIRQGLQALAELRDLLWRRLDLVAARIHSLA